MTRAAYPIYGYVAFYIGGSKLKETNLTEGPIFKKLISFSLPMIAGNLLQQVYNLVDTLIVGRCLGASALAAVGSAYTLMIFITSIIIGLCMGSGAFFSSDYGSGSETALREDVFLSFVFIAAVSVIINVIVYPAMNLIMAALQTPEELLGLTRDYVSVIFAGIIFVFLYNFFAYLLRSLGNSFIPLVFLAISSVINIVLDIWFVISLDMGVSGAALATVIAQAFSGIGITAYSLLRVPFLRKFSAENLHFNRRRFVEIVENDFSTGLQQSVMNFGILMIQGLVNSFGSVIMAAFAAAVKIDTLAYMPAQEFGNAYSLFVSQNHGANRKERIRKGTRISLITSASFCLAVSAFIICLADKLMELFIKASETDIISAGATYLRIEGACYVGIGILFLMYGYFRGVNRPGVSLILTIISLGTRVLLSYALAPATPLGVIAIWLSIPIGWFLADAVGYVFYRRRNVQGKEL